MNLADLQTRASAPTVLPERCHDRETLLVGFDTDADVLNALLPAALTPDGSNSVLCEFAATPDPRGRGSCTEFNVLIPALAKGERVLFRAYSTADDGAWLPRGRTRMVIVHDTLTGILELHGRPVVIAAMNYRRAHLLEDQRRFGTLSSADTVRQLRPVRVAAAGDGIDALPVQRLIAQPWSDIHVQCAWMGSASLDLLWPAGAPLAALPVHRVHGGLHCVVDFRREPLRRLCGGSATALATEATSRYPQLVAEGGVQ